MSTQTEQTSGISPPAPAQGELARKQKRTKQEHRGHFGPFDPEAKRARGGHKLRVNKDDRELNTRKKPRPKKKRSTPKDGERYMDMKANEYNISSLLKGPNDIPRFNYTMIERSRRPLCGEAPANIPDSALQRLQGIFVGKERPFYKAAPRGSNSTAMPMTVYARKLLLGTAVLDIVNNILDDALHISIFGSNDIVQVFEAYVHQCRPELKLYIYHYSRSPVTFSRDNTHYQLHQITGDGETLLVNGKAFQQATRLVIGAGMTIIESDAYHLLLKTRATTVVYDIGYRSVVGMGTLGTPIPEVIFSGISLASSFDEPPLRGARIVSANTKLIYSMDPPSFFMQGGRHLATIKLQASEGSILMECACYKVEEMVAWPILVSEEAGVIKKEPKHDSHYNPQVEKRVAATQPMDINAANRGGSTTYILKEQRIKGAPPPTAQQLRASLADLNGEVLFHAMSRLRFAYLRRIAGARTQRILGMILQYLREHRVTDSFIMQLATDDTTFLEHVKYMSDILTLEIARGHMENIPLPDNSPLHGPVMRSAEEAVEEVESTDDAALGKDEPSSEAEKSDHTGAESDEAVEVVVEEIVRSIEEEQAQQAEGEVEINAKNRELKNSVEPPPVSVAAVEAPLAAIREFVPAAEPAPVPEVQVPNHLTHRLEGNEAALNIPNPHAEIREDGSRWLTANTVRFFHAMGARFPSVEEVRAVAPSTNDMWRWAVGSHDAMPTGKLLLGLLGIGALYFAGKTLARAALASRGADVTQVVVGDSTQFLANVIAPIVTIGKTVAVGVLVGVVKQHIHNEERSTAAEIVELPAELDQCLVSAIMSHYNDQVEPTPRDWANWCANFSRGVSDERFPGMRGGDIYLGRAMQIWRQVRYQTYPRGRLIRESKFFQGFVQGVAVYTAYKIATAVPRVVTGYVTRSGATLISHSTNRFLNYGRLASGGEISDWLRLSFFREAAKDPSVHENIKLLFEQLELVVETPIVEELTKEACSYLIPGAFQLYTASTAFGLAEYGLRVLGAGVTYQQGDLDSCIMQLFMALLPLAMHHLIGKYPLPVRIVMHSLYNACALVGVTATIRASKRVNLATGSSKGAIMIVIVALVIWLLREEEQQTSVVSKRPGALCTEHLTRARVRPGALLTPKTFPSNCNPSAPYLPVGPYCQTYHVFKFGSCGHNVLRAMCHRMGGIPSGIKAQFEEGESTTDGWLRVTAEIDENIARDFSTTHQEIIDAYTHNHQPLITHVEWLKRFPEAKARNMHRMWFATYEIPTSYDCFVKSEKSVMHIREFDKLGFAGHKVLHSDAHTLGPLTTKLDPRGISVPHEALRVEGGPWCNYLNMSLRNGFETRFFYNPGHTPAQLSNWFSAATYGVELGAWPYAIAVQGDDILIIIKRGGVIEYVSIDLSRYDMTQRPAHFMETWDLVDALGLTENMPDGLRDRFLEQQGCLGHLKRYNSRYGKLRVLGTMASGDGLTITFNSLTILQAAILAVRAGVENVEATLRDYGFTPTYTTAQVDRIVHVDFLQSRPWLTAQGSRVFGPKPGRVLSRFFYTDKPLNKQWKKQLYSYRLAQGLMAVASHVPIINDICDRVMLVTQHVIGLAHVEPAYDAEICAELMPWRVGTFEKEHPHTVEEMAELYGVSINSIEKLRIKIRTWEWMQPIDDDAETQSIVESICSVDLA